MYEYFACAAFVPVAMETHSLGLKLQMVVSHHVGDGNQTWVLWKSSQCS